MHVQEEREKFDVSPGWTWPGLDPVPGGGETEEVHQIVSTYFDTSDLGLLAYGVTLRRRVGGGETGWDLVVPAGSERTELHSRSNRRTVPRELSEAVSGLRGDDELVPVATISTTRTARRLVDADGSVVVEIDDDRVEGTAPGRASVAETWREIEVELGPAAQPKTREKIIGWLRKAGAEPSRSTTKLHRVLHLPSSSAENGGGGQAKGSKKETVGGLVTAYIGEQCDVLVGNDVALRTGGSVVHKTRVAVRRLRSTMRVFDDVFDQIQAAAFDADLTWYAGVLGAVRDCDVLAARLENKIAELPPEHVLGPAAAHLQEALALDRRAATDTLREAMGSDRYRRLLGTVRRWRQAPPLTGAAAAKAKHAEPYLRTIQRKATKRLKQADGEVEQLHRARKAMKRLRYTGELVGDVLPKARKIAKRAKGYQTELGAHQDAVVSAAFLQRLGARAGSSPGHNGFTYGVLMANELETAERIRRALSH